MNHVNVELKNGLAIKGNIHTCKRNYKIKFYRKQIFLKHFGSGYNFAIVKKVKRVDKSRKFGWEEN